jgi:hypothetical protein
MSVEKVSPPFEGGVVGMIDSLIFTTFYFPTGVVDSLISSYPPFHHNYLVILSSSIPSLRGLLQTKDPHDSP